MLDINNKLIKQGDYVKLIGCNVKNDNGIYIVDAEYKQDDFCLKKVTVNGELSNTKYNIFFLDSRKINKNKNIIFEIISKENLKQANTEVKTYLNSVTAKEKVFTFSQGNENSKYIRIIKPVYFVGRMYGLGGGSDGGATYEIIDKNDKYINFHLIGAKGEKISQNINNNYNGRDIVLTLNIDLFKKLVNENYIVFLDRQESTKGERQSKTEDKQIMQEQTIQPKQEKKEIKEHCYKCACFGVDCAGHGEPWTGCVYYKEVEEQQAQKVTAKPELAEAEQIQETQTEINTTLKIGDKVTYTNDNGVVFRDKVITGYYEGDCNTFKNRVYIDIDCYWYPVKRENLKLEIQEHEIQPRNEYIISQDIDTRDNSIIYIVKIQNKLSKDEYIKTSKYMQTIGGYYSKFKHGFIFKNDPSNLLNGTAQAVPQEANKAQETVKQEKQFIKQKQIEKINAQIESAQKKIDNLSGNYKTNTYKRMREQEVRESKIEGLQLDINILDYLLTQLEYRDLTLLESNLIISTFRYEIRSYYNRHNLYNSIDRPTAAKEIEYPYISSNYAEWYNKEVPKKQNKLKKAGINNTSELIAAVKEYENIYNAASKPQDYKAKQIKTLERQYKMQQKGDINFTPSSVAEQLINYARINENSRVLEPSAGIGNIADEIKKVTNNIDVVERMISFAELLELKGYNVVGSDFLEYNTDKKYDAIIMNPPFSDEQRHIKHAYKLLNEGGTIVSITSHHWTFANDKKSQDFRNWLENENYFTVDLESGTFENTGVASKIVIIEKVVAQSNQYTA